MVAGAGASAGEPHLVLEGMSECEGEIEGPTQI